MIAPALVVLVALAAWEAIVRAEKVDELILPAPTQVVEALWKDRTLLGEDTLVTLTEVALGLGGAVVLGVGVALAMHLSPAVGRALRPLVVGSQAIPVPVIAPLLLFLLGFGLAPKILVVVLVCFFPVAINVHDGLRAADPEQRKLMRALRATRWQTLRWLEAPSALPQAFTGLRIAAAVSVIGAVFAEWIAAERGLGHTVRIANGQLESPRAFAATFLLFALAIGLYAAFAAAERRIVTWNRPGEP